MNESMVRNLTMSERIRFGLIPELIVPEVLEGDHALFMLDELGFEPDNIEAEFDKVKAVADNYESFVQRLELLVDTWADSDDGDGELYKKVCDMISEAQEEMES